MATIMVAHSPGSRTLECQKERILDYSHHSWKSSSSMHSVPKKYSSSTRRLYWRIALSLSATRKSPSNHSNMQLSLTVKSGSFEFFRFVRVSGFRARMERRAFILVLFCSFKCTTMYYCPQRARQGSVNVTESPLAYPCWKTAK